MTIAPKGMGGDRKGAPLRNDHRADWVWRAIARVRPYGMTIAPTGAGGRPQGCVPTDDHRADWGRRATARVRPYG